ncbi:hypothetical protein AB0B31_07060 [Catellatospora citrea]|uniref:hypothetical protein n=1 Tax=Catellatospora citrea TaxID=53366 RepID=UPI0033E12FFE
MITYFGVRAALLDRFGQPAAELIRTQEEWVINTGGSVDAISPYRYMSRVFLDGILVPAIERCDEPTIRACCNFLETALTGGDRDLWECISIRVTDRILGDRGWTSAVLALAGPRWTRELRRWRRGHPLAVLDVGPARRWGITPGTGIGSRLVTHEPAV